METEIETTTKVKLTLTSEEADWLRDIMQNPLHTGESNKDKAMREMFFGSMPDNRPRSNVAIEDDSHEYCL